MRNLAVKLSILLGRFHEGVSPQRFMGLPPVLALHRFKEELPQAIRHAVFFTFTDKALLDMLDQEFFVDTERLAMVFVKPSLDAQSIILADPVSHEFSDDDELILHKLTQWYFDATRRCFKVDLPAEKLADLQEEIRHNLRSYAAKNSFQGVNKLYELFGQRRAILDFSHSLCADALFKTAGANALFGETSAYAQAWLRKQVVRQRMAQAVEQALLRDHQQTAQLK